MHLNKFTSEVLHRLPYFLEGGGTTVEYKSMLIDWTQGIFTFSEEIYEQYS